MVEVARQAGVFGSEAWCNWFFSLSLASALYFPRIREVNLRELFSLLFR